MSACNLPDSLSLAAVSAQHSLSCTLLSFGGASIRAKHYFQFKLSHVALFAGFWYIMYRDAFDKKRKRNIFTY